MKKEKKQYEVMGVSIKELDAQFKEKGRPILVKKGKQKGYLGEFQ